jgi:two-component system chemotaxis sensor kinase CheA
VIRDITRTNGKDIRLEILGEKTELDKRMIDELGDPLIHMVRNSADHGIERPEARLAAGKPAQGVITLNAFHRGNRIVIQVTDDGKGLDPDRIRQKAIDRGLVNQGDAERLSSQQIYNLIWEPGFSTAEQVTEISGRGMGMDIVKSKIEELNGTVDIESVPGQGATLTIKLPLTMAILPSLMAEVGDGIFALPIESVVEIVRFGADKVNTVHGVPTATVRGRVVSIARLDELFAWNGDGAAKGVGASTDITMVILGSEGRELGLTVDRLLGEEDIVIKSLADNYRHVTGIAGASILGDGRVALILDIAALVEAAKRRGATMETQA